MKWTCGVILVILVTLLGLTLGNQAWWKTANLYQIYPRSFKDSDGDGVGDLKGITQVAQYFNYIGADAVWLSPIYTSPMADFGYDISNYTDIDPIFGTMADFEDLVAKFKELGIRLLLDFVPNHTSDEHLWFKKSVQNDTDYIDFYVWHDAKYDANGTRMPPNNWISVFAGSAWEWSDVRQQYYLHQFATKQPDLNYRNPAVQGNMTAVINFWLDKGVDGFRMDAVQFLFENDSFPDEPPVPGKSGDTWDTLYHIYTKNLNETRVMLREWGDVVFNRVQEDGIQRLVILEVYENTSVAVGYYNPNLDMEFPFNFNLLANGNLSTRASQVMELIYDWISQAPQGGQLNWAVGNHDNPRVTDKYGPEMVDAINLLTGCLPGIKVTYNGEEFGMRDTFIRWDETLDPQGRNLGPDRYLEGTRDPERTPMQWDDSVSAGFSSNLDTWLPVNPNYWWLNVDAQKNADKSHLKVYQLITKARQDPVLMYGDLNVYAPDNDTLVVVRNYQYDYFVLLINMGSNYRSYTSQNLFAAYSLDVSMYVVVSSVNAGYQPGVFQEQGTIRLNLRPKAAVLLTTKTWAPSPTTAPSNATTPSSSTTSGGHRLVAISPILACAVLLLVKVLL